MLYTVLALILLAFSVCSLLLKTVFLLRQVRENLTAAACLAFSLLSAGLSCLKSTGSANAWEWLLMLGGLLQGMPTHAGVVAALPFLILGLAGLVVAAASWLVIVSEPNEFLGPASTLEHYINAGPLAYGILLREKPRGGAAAEPAWEPVAESVNRRLCAAALARRGLADRTVEEKVGNWAASARSQAGSLESEKAHVLLAHDGPASGKALKVDSATHFMEVLRGPGHDLGGLVVFAVALNRKAIADAHQQFDRLANSLGEF